MWPKSDGKRVDWSGYGHYGLELLPDGGGVQRGDLFYRRGKHPPGADGFLVCLEHIQPWGREKHRPIARPGLGRGYHQFASDPVNLPLHPKGAGTEIQIVPLEGQDLAPAPAGGQLQQQKLVAAVPPGLDQ